jgi:hypothetical protein
MQKVGVGSNEGGLVGEKELVQTGMFWESESGDSSEPVSDVNGGVGKDVARMPDARSESGAVGAVGGEDSVAIALVKHDGVGVSPSGEH